MVLTSIVISSLKKVTEGGGIPNAVHLRVVVTFELMVNSVGVSQGPSGNSVISGEAGICVRREERREEGRGREEERGEREEERGERGGEGRERGGEGREEGKDA